MLPYFEWHKIVLGPITLQVWGLFVALGFIFGAYMAAWLAKRKGQNPKVIYDLLPWLILAGIGGGRLGYVLFYNLPYYLDNPLEALALWNGGSSIFGGLIACFIVAMIFFYRRKLDPIAYSDTFIFGLPLGIFWGRVGCFLIHDHPGTATDFFLGTRFPDGVVRHDLGLYEAIVSLILAGLFVILARQPKPTGTFIAIFCLVYGVIRFGLDFLRAVDVRYLGLTPAQYLSLILVSVGVSMFVWIRAQRKLV